MAAHANWRGGVLSTSLLTRRHLFPLRPGLRGIFGAWRGGQAGQGGDWPCSCAFHRRSRGHGYAGGDPAVRKQRGKIFKLYVRENTSTRECSRETENASAGNRGVWNERESPKYRTGDGGRAERILGKNKIHRTGPCYTVTCIAWDSFTGW
jgi:hypothetical protein